MEKSKILLLLSSMTLVSVYDYTILNIQGWGRQMLALCIHSSGPSLFRLIVQNKHLWLKDCPLHVMNSHRLIQKSKNHS